MTTEHIILYSLNAYTNVTQDESNYKFQHQLSMDYGTAIPDRELYSSWSCWEGKVTFN